MNYISTRGNQEKKTFWQGVLQGLAPDGGLYVPEELPTIDFHDYIDLDYRDLAVEVLSLFVDHEDRDKIKSCVLQGYKNSFFKENLIGLHQEEDFSVLELYHGQTAAFKDFALALLPQFMKEASKEKLLILTATSGDTGKAAMEGFKNVEGIDIVVFYPHQGVSEIQYLQMATQEGDNTHSLAIQGNFDDAQRGVKELFLDQDLKSHLEKNQVHLSSANSINIGRLLPQSIYYIYAYLQLVKKGTLTYGDKLDVVVPTGNFGNILAGYLAQKMGLPLGDFICASNKNNVLSDFLEAGVYDINRPFFKTSSPSMDILVSSNVERFLYFLTGDAKKVKDLQEDLVQKGRYELDQDLKDKMASWHGYFAQEEEVQEEIRRMYREKNYLMDPHTAVASLCYQKYQRDFAPQRHALILSTASPYKFPHTVLKALGEEGDWTDKEAIDHLADLTGKEVPSVIKDLWVKEQKPEELISYQDMKKIVEKIGDGE